VDRLLERVPHLSRAFFAARVGILTFFFKPRSETKKSKIDLRKISGISWSLGPLEAGYPWQERQLTTAL
jgi:hypothetical protein